MPNILIYILNVAGLTINFIGVAMMFMANPKISPSIGMFPNEKDLIEHSKLPRKNKLFRLGMLVLSIGFLIQLIALILAF